VPFFHLLIESIFTLYHTNGDKSTKSAYYYGYNIVTAELPESSTAPNGIQRYELTSAFLYDIIIVRYKHFVYRNLA